MIMYYFLPIDELEVDQNLLKYAFNNPKWRKRNKFKIRLYQLRNKRFVYKSMNYANFTSGSFKFKR